ncbi:hypothetical protein [Salipiger aestuarii]|uniref:hypothetical protein n=1 Tax=Salipiger aestuarii TaxID=568098 RepID=UPI0012393085|nr:hypothetical protein [Salipiger aestuarii]KAA8605928.1 hypothetical protein AL037_20950 [Salipiger aestuarii]
MTVEELATHFKGVADWRAHFTSVNKKEYADSPEGPPRLVQMVTVYRSTDTELTTREYQELAALLDRTGQQEEAQPAPRELTHAERRRNEIRVRGMAGRYHHG